MPVYYTSFAVFLFSAISLVVPTGYSYGAALLFLGSLVYVWRPAAWKALEWDDWKIVFALIFFSAVWVLEVLLYEQGISGVDKPSRFLAAALVLPFLLRFSPLPVFFWSGLALGSILTGSWSVWQKIVEEVSRAGGFTNTIQFGNISMLMGLLCLAGLSWAYLQPRRVFWLIFLFAGFVMGVLGSVLSGSRGGWIALPIAFFVLYRGYSDFLRWHHALYILLGLLVLASLVYSIPQTEVRHRVQLAAAEVQDYLETGNARSSVGARLEMWHAASRMIAEKPLLGWGSQGYMAAQARMAEEGVVDRFILRFDHPHNEYLNVTSKRGLLGLAALLLLYFIPLRLFYKGFRISCLQCRSYAVAGAILSVTYIDFGLTQVFFSHNSGVMVYSFMLVVLWSIFVTSHQFRGSRE
ncbi:MAG: O-antigen ligase family protein [Marinospirillum sp.]|nr:O-antigen ligase family protein [Marinospirillum sp.]